jgi:hypothetical protein
MLVLNNQGKTVTKESLMLLFCFDFLVWCNVSFAKKWSHGIKSAILVGKICTGTSKTKKKSSRTIGGRFGFDAAVTFSFAIQRGSLLCHVPFPSKSPSSPRLQLL